MEKTIEDWAESHQTSPKIAVAISSLTHFFRSLEDIWNDPSNEEIINVWIRATDCGKIKSDTLEWSGSTLDDMMRKRGL